MKPWTRFVIGAGFIGISYFIICKLKENCYLEYIKDNCIDLSEVYKDETKHMLIENKVYY